MWSVVWRSRGETGSQTKGGGGERVLCGREGELEPESGRGGKGVWSVVWRSRGETGSQTTSQEGGGGGGGEGRGGEGRGGGGGGEGRGGEGRGGGGGGREGRGGEGRGGEGGEGRRRLRCNNSAVFQTEHNFGWTLKGGG